MTWDIVIAGHAEVGLDDIEDGGVVVPELRIDPDIHGILVAQGEGKQRMP